MRLGLITKKRFLSQFVLVLPGLTASSSASNGCSSVKGRAQFSVFCPLAPRQLGAGIGRGYLIGIRAFCALCHCLWLVDLVWKVLMYWSGHINENDRDQSLISSATINWSKVSEKHEKFHLVFRVWMDCWGQNVIRLLNSI